MNLLTRSEKLINCPLCNYDWAVIKYTKTEHLMLRCDECKVLLFANSLESEDAILRLCKFTGKQNYFDMEKDEIEF